MNSDFHSKPFDHSTKTKLLIYRDYLREWLPVFIESKKLYWNQINVFDFFSGPGEDSNGEKGSPLITIEEVKNYLKTIKTRNLLVNLYFSDNTKWKYEILSKKVSFVYSILHLAVCFEPESAYNWTLCIL